MSRGGRKLTTIPYVVRHHSATPICLRTQTILRGTQPRLEFFVNDVDVSIMNQYTPNELRMRVAGGPLWNAFLDEEYVALCQRG